MNKNKSKVIKYSLKTLTDDFRKFSIALAAGSSIGMIYRGFDVLVIYSFTIALFFFLSGHLMQLFGGVYD